MDTRHLSPANPILAGRRSLLFVALLFTLLGVVIYFNSLEVPFYFDDSQNIENNKAIQLDEITWSGLKAAAISQYPVRAVAHLSFALNYYFGGLQVAGYHAVNIAIHIINAILVFWLVRLTLQLPVLGYANEDATLVALVTALLWMVNPVQTQTVTYIVQRWNSLAVMFYLGSFLLYIHARLSRRSVGRWLLFPGSAVCGLLGLFTKEITAVLPFFILLYEWFFFQDLRRSWLWRNLFLIGVILAVFGVITYLYTGEHLLGSLLEFSLPEYDNRWFTLGERLLTEPRVVLFYLGLLAFPAPSRLNLDHDFPLSYSLWNPPETFLAIALLFALLSSALWLARRERLLAFCILWYLGHLVIESSVIGLEIIYEHRTYLPSIGFFLLAVVLAYRIRIPRWSVTAGFCVLAVLWSFWTIERNAVWGDPLLFWSDAVAKSPGLARPYYSLAQAYIDADDLDAALSQLNKAIQVYDEYEETHPTAAHPKRLTTYDWVQALSYSQRGSILTVRGDLDEAKSDFNRAIHIAPGKVTTAYLHRGAIHHYQGDLEAAMKDYSTVIRRKPEDSEAFEYRGDLRRQMKDYSGAVSDYRRLTKLKPDDPDAYRKLGMALRGLGNYKEAEQAFNASLEQAPPDWEKRRKVMKQLFVLRHLESEEVTDQGPGAGNHPAELP